MEDAAAFYFIFQVNLVKTSLCKVAQSLYFGRSFLKFYHLQTFVHLKANQTFTKAIVKSLYVEWLRDVVSSF